MEFTLHVNCTQLLLLIINCSEPAFDYFWWIPCLWRNPIVHTEIIARNFKKVNTDQDCPTMDPKISFNKKLSYRRETARQLRMSRLANWSCNAQNTAESQRLYYFFTFKRSDSRSAGRKRILTSNVIHFAISYPPTRGSISSYNTACRISEVFEDV